MLRLDYKGLIDGEWNERQLVNKRINQGEGD